MYKFKTLILFFIIKFFIINGSLSNDLDEKIHILENYLNNLDSSSILFEQKSFDGEVDKGWMIIKKPNNIRIEYDQPNPNIILSNKDYLIIYDADDDLITHLPITDGPWTIFTEENLRLSSKENDTSSHGFVKNIEEVNFNNKINFLYKIVMKTSNGVFLDSEIIVYTKTDPFEIIGWKIVNANDQEIIIKIYKILKENFNENNLDIFTLTDIDKKSGNVWKGPFNRLPAKRYPSGRF